MVRRSTMSAVLLRMEEKGLLKRTSVEHDARLKKITLTERGMQLYRKMEHSLDKMEGRMISGLSAEEEATLLSLLEKVKTNLENEKS
jgi:DNA-binding MarR family transcriptional regulator